MVEHVAIQDADRHEVKHASSAALNQVLHSNGDGTTSFKLIDYSVITGTPILQGYRNVLTAFSTGTQNPVGLDNPLQVTFGPPQTLDDVSLDINGTLTFNTAGDYSIALLVRQGRTAGGGSATLLSRLLVNDTQVLNTNTAVLPDATSVTPFAVTLFVSAVIGDTLKLQVMRDSVGANNGGLTSFVPTVVGWNVSPSATIVVSKFRGDV